MGKAMYIYKIKHEACTISYMNTYVYTLQLLFKKPKAMTAEYRNQMLKQEDNSRGGNKTGKDADLVATHS